MIGSRCRIEETGELGTVVEVYRDAAGILVPAKVQLDIGTVVDVVNKTVTILTLIKQVAELLQPAARAVGRFFKNLFGRE